MEVFFLFQNVKPKDFKRCIFFVRHFLEILHFNSSGQWQHALAGDQVLLHCDKTLPSKTLKFLGGKFKS